MRCGRRLTATLLLVCLISACTLGCGARHEAKRIDPSQSFYRQSATEIDYPNVAAPISGDLLSTPPPLSLIRSRPSSFHEISLEQATRLALANARILRDLGGQLLRAPQNAATVYNPAISETDPRFGIDAALSAFDALFSSTAYFEKNDRALNNQFFGGGTRQLQQDAYVFQNQLTKRGASGTQYTLRNITDYDANNAPGNAFPSAWNSNIETEFRHPLLQGGGVDYNRIAGPGGSAGVYTGVLIARINTDVSIAELEVGVRTLLSDVENAYWDLYFAYRDLHAKMAARDTALETWRKVHSLYITGRRGGEAEKEAQAREQYFRYEEEVQNALAGQPLDGTRTYNGSSGGTFRGNGGVMTADRRLRLLIGLPIVDGELLRPTDEPRPAPVAFDWQPLLAESLSRRVELRRQRWLVKRRELELSASRNFTLPQLDTVGRYRWRGFGNDLIGGPGGPFSSATGTLFDGKFQEWQLGAEFSVPLGFRKGHAAVRNAEWNLTRERSLLHELERQVVHDLGTSVAEAERAFLVVQTTYNRRLATFQQASAAQAAFEADQATLDFLLESQRLLADADVRHQRAQVEYAIALKNVQFEKGSLLEYNGVHMAESPWTPSADRDIARNARTQLLAGPLSYILSPGRRVTTLPANAPPSMIMPAIATKPNTEASVEVAPSAAPSSEAPSAIVPIAPAGNNAPSTNPPTSPSVIPAGEPRSLNLFPDAAPVPPTTRVVP
ncbi:MAG: TolC family protein [Planctomycetia bacterium]|nr:TolC family protein [Planctomycetia bacterium]